MMIQKENGVRASRPSRRAWPGVSRVNFDLRWETEPGWIALSFEAPVLCFVANEVGGRCQIRMVPDQPTEGEYFGTGHLSFVAAAQPLIVHAGEMRQARLACYLIDANEARYLSPSEVGAVATASSRFMFKDDRLHTCANLLNECDGKDDGSPYGASLARALLAALLGPALRQNIPPPAGRLTGAPLARVFAHILDYLDQSVTVDELAQVAGISSTQFSRAFREATGLSPQRWQMDARVRSAQRLMIDDPTGPLAEVAALAGFSDQSHFSRAFLKIVGVTPTAWLHQRP